MWVGVPGGAALGRGSPLVLMWPASRWSREARVSELPVLSRLLAEATLADDVGCSPLCLVVNLYVAAKAT